VTATPRRGWLFWGSAAAGWAVILWGVRGALHHHVDTRPGQLVRFLLGGDEPGGREPGRERSIRGQGCGPPNIVRHRHAGHWTTHDSNVPIGASVHRSSGRSSVVIVNRAGRMQHKIWRVTCDFSTEAS